MSAEIAGLARYGVRIYVITIPDLGQTPLAKVSGTESFLTDLTDLFNSGILALRE